MALPSQTARPLKIRGGVGGKRRRRRRGGGGFIIGLILIGGGAGATWWLWPDSVDAPEGPEHPDTPIVELAPGTPPAPSGALPGAAAGGATPGNDQPESQPSTAPGDDDAAQSASTPETEAAAAVDSESSSRPGADDATRTPSALDQAAVLVRQNKPVEARAILSAALRSGALSPSDADHVRATLSAINEGLVFSKELAVGDPHVALYTIKSGDSLSRIVDDQNLPVNWRFLQRLNGIKQGGHIGVGQRLKTIVTPFHATVSKHDHRLDLWLGDGDDAVFVRSFNVGLGEFDSTPVGTFRVRRGGKLVNPSWRNPRTGEQFNADDPLNPIGEYWIGLEGIEAHNLQEQGFGVHGTIDPDSIGRSESMGCVRLDDEDIALLYELLASGRSTVTVVESR